MNRAASIGKTFLVGLVLIGGLSGQAFAAASAEMAVVERAAEALGGKSKLMAVKTVKIVGFGGIAYQNGGSNTDASLYAPPRLINSSNVRRTYDIENGRVRYQEDNTWNFVFANTAQITNGVKVDRVLDGDIAFNISQDGKATRDGLAGVRDRKFDYLQHPITLMRAALDPASKLSNLRDEGRWQAFDMTTARGVNVTVGIDKQTSLPAWVGWVGPNENLGDVQYRDHFTGYRPEVATGLLVPIGFNIIMDFRNVSQTFLTVELTTINGPADPAMTASADIRAAALPTPNATLPNVTQVAKGVWYIRARGALYEFDDHLTLFECGGGCETKLAAARATVPNKPLTQLIVSHHHFDHSAGLRLAVSQGLTIITHRSNIELFQETTQRPAKVYPDAQGPNPKPFKYIAVDEQMTLKDGSNEVRLYHSLSGHVGGSIAAYSPAHRLLAQGDFVDLNWNQMFWPTDYIDTVKFWKLNVDKDLPVHGDIRTYAEVLQLLKNQVKAAEGICDRIFAAGFTKQGCPVANARFADGLESGN